MTYNVLAVCENGVENYPLYPLLNDDILIVPEALDGPLGEPIRVSKIVVRRKVGNGYTTVTETKEIVFQVWITASRVIFYCKKFEKGGGWVGFGLGGLAVAVVANSVSHAIAANRRKGKALIGNIRYPWVSSVMFSPRNGFGTEENVRIAFVDGTDDSRPEGDITFSIERHNNANRVARNIVDRVIAYRYASGEELDAEELRRFEELRHSGLAALPEKGRLTSYGIGFWGCVPVRRAVAPPAPPAFPPGAPATSPTLVDAPASGVPLGLVPIPVQIEGTLDFGFGTPKAPVAKRPSFCEACGSVELGENFCTDCGAPMTVPTA
jgi:hypothetical protein